MPCIPDLVYDVGMHNGDDTAYYLHKGYRVVAIEANPILARAGHERFSPEISAGRLTIVDRAIAREAGEIELFVSSRFDLLGSLDRDSAARLGGEVGAVRVPCLPFRDILATHGVPYFMKIDIEGSDRLCLDALAPPGVPDYISIEMSHGTGNRDIETLAALGYSGFKCLRQHDFMLISPENIDRQIHLRRRRASGGLASLGARIVRRLDRIRQRRSDRGWKFSSGSSGPFGDDLPGRWLSPGEMLAVWQRLHDIDAELGAGGLGEWFDIHAALTPARAG